ncbi:MAG TPA: glycosyltransferase family 39 protein, partial [Patescibacteria group bacterium]|nr:glycosyltransferase family 39 protein [Patescibacteria group bacterium]
IILRFYQLGSNPPSLDWDEASIGYNAYSILKTGADEYGNKMPLSFRSFDDYKPPVYVYLTVPSVAVLGLTAFAVRLPAAIFGIVAVVAVYFFVLELLSSWSKAEIFSETTRQAIALLSMLFLAISPWHLQFSRAAFEGNIGDCFLILALLFFFKAWRQAAYYLLFALFMILSMYSYHSFRLIDPLIVGILIIFFLKEIFRQKKWFAVSVFIIIVSTIPIYSSFIQEGGTSARLSMVTVFSDPVVQQLSAQQELKAHQQHNLINEIIYNRRVIFIPQIIKGYLDHFNFDFLFLHGDGGVQHHAYNIGMLYLWDFPFIFLGIIYLLRKRTKKIWLLFFVFLLAPLPAAITTGTPHPVRAIAMIPAFQIFAAAGVVWLAILLQKKKILLVTVLSLSGLLLVINFAYYLYSYYVLTPVKYGYFWQYGNKQAVEYAAQHESSYQRIIMTYVYDQPYIYYLFYNKVDPKWYQKNWNYSGNGTVDRFYRKIGIYEFMDITPKDFNRKNTLLIGTPQEIPDGVGKLKDTITFPDGRVAYKIVAI